MAKQIQISVGLLFCLLSSCSFEPDQENNTQNERNCNPSTCVANLTSAQVGEAVMLIPEGWKVERFDNDKTYFRIAPAKPSTSKQMPSIHYGYQRKFPKELCEVILPFWDTMENIEVLRRHNYGIACMVEFDFDLPKEGRYRAA